MRFAFLLWVVVGVGCAARKVNTPEEDVRTEVYSLIKALPDECTDDPVTIGRSLNASYTCKGDFMIDDRLLNEANGHHSSFGMPKGWVNSGSSLDRGDYEHALEMLRDPTKARKDFEALRKEANRCHASDFPLSTSNGYQQWTYKCVNGQWEIDEEESEKQNQLEAEINARNVKLFASLSTRPLSHRELLELNSFINITPMVPYHAEDKDKELHKSLTRQLWLLVKAGRIDAAKVPAWIPENNEDLIDMIRLLSKED